MFLQKHFFVLDYLKDAFNFLAFSRLKHSQEWSFRFILHNGYFYIMYPYKLRN